MAGKQQMRLLPNLVNDGTLKANKSQKKANESDLKSKKGVSDRFHSLYFFSLKYL